MRAVVDRIDEGLAVLHMSVDVGAASPAPASGPVGPAERELVVPVGLLPADVAEGDWFTVRFEPDPDRTAARREDLQARVERLRKGRSGGRFG